MAEAIFEEFGQAFDVTLIPSSGGVFEVEVEGDLIYSKKATGSHAEYEDVARAIRERVA